MVNNDIGERMHKRYEQIMREDKEDISPQQAISQVQKEFSEELKGSKEEQIPSQTKDIKKYEKKFVGKEFGTRKKEKQPKELKVFDTIEEMDEYLKSLPEKRREEELARMKGFRSADERRRAIEYANRKLLRKHDIETAKEREGTPLEAYYKVFGGKHPKIEEIEKEIKKIGEAKEEFEPKTKLQKVFGRPFKSKELVTATEKLGELAKKGGKYVVGSAILALQKKQAGDTRTLEEIRKEIEREQRIEQAKVAEERAFQIELATAYGGGRRVYVGRQVAGGITLAKRQKQISAPRPKQFMDMRIPAPAKFMDMNLGGSGFSLGEAKPAGKPMRTTKVSQKVVVQPQRDAADVLGLKGFGTPTQPVKAKMPSQPSGDPFGLSDYSGVKTPRTHPEQRKVSKGVSAQSMVDMGNYSKGGNMVSLKMGGTNPVGNMFGSAKNPVQKKTKKNEDFMNNLRF